MVDSMRHFKSVTCLRIDNCERQLQYWYYLVVRSNKTTLDWMEAWLAVIQYSTGCTGMHQQTLQVRAYACLETVKPVRLPNLLQRVAPKDDAVCMRVCL